MEGDVLIKCGYCSHQYFSNNKDLSKSWCSNCGKLVNDN